MIITQALADAIAMGIEPTDPGVLDAHPEHVLLIPETGETLSLDPEDYRWAHNETDDELRTSMEIQIESAWHTAIENDQTAVLVPAHLL